MCLFSKPRCPRASAYTRLLSLSAFCSALLCSARFGQWSFACTIALCHDLSHDHNHAITITLTMTKTMTHCFFPNQLTRVLTPPHLSRSVPTSGSWSVVLDYLDHVAGRKDPG